MRQKADKLEKGKWYADVRFSNVNMTFLKYSHENIERYHFSEQRGEQSYKFSKDGFVTIDSRIFKGFIPTPEDIEKYNLNEDE